MMHMLINPVTWFRFIVKKVDPMQLSYSWSEMSFHTKWTLNSTVNICFDVPKASQMRLHQALASSQQRHDVVDIYASHVIILDEILAMFDESVWALRDEVRRIEKVRMRYGHAYISVPGLTTNPRVETKSLDQRLTTLSSTTSQGTLYIRLRLLVLP